MKILQVMPQYPWPMVDGGKVGLGNIAQEYAAQGHEVHVLCFAGSDTPRQDPPGVTVHVVQHVPNNSPLRILQSLFRRRALYMWKHDLSSMRHAIDGIIEREGIEVLHCDHTCMAPLVADAGRAHGLVWGLRLHNVEWMIWQRYAERFPRWNPARWYLADQARKVRREERQALEQADVVFAITPTDLERVRSLAPTANAIVAPAGVTPEAWQRDRHPTQPPEVVFASNFRWVHNVDALRWFLDHVWPRVHFETDATFHVIGVEVPEWVQEHAANSVSSDGFVPDLADRYAAASISVAPLFVGSGMRLKIIEAMAAGLPVVATSISAEGIELSDADGLFRSDSPERMAAQIIRLANDAELCDRLGQVSREAVSRDYTWKSSVGRMAHALQQLSADGE